MRQNYETSKLYYGFPVILLGYKDANFKYNFHNLIVHHIHLEI